MHYFSSAPARKHADVPTLKHPSAVIPLAMSTAAFAMVLAHAVKYGIVPETDEGTAAHLFQLLMAGQTPVILFFAVKWLPRAPAPALRVLGLHAVAALMAFAAVFLLT